MCDEVYVKPGEDEIIEVIFHKQVARLHPDPCLEIERGERYGFLGLKKAKENLYTELWEIESNKLYTRQEYLDKFGIDPENDNRSRFEYFVTLKRASGRQRTTQFKSEEEAKDWIKENYPEYTVRVE